MMSALLMVGALFSRLRQCRMCWRALTRMMLSELTRSLLLGLIVLVEWMAYVCAAPGSTG